MRKKKIIITVAVIAVIFAVGGLMVATYSPVAPGKKVVEMPKEEIEDGLIDVSLDNPADAYDIPQIFSAIDLIEQPEGIASQQEMHQVKYFGMDSLPDDMPVILLAIDDWKGTIGLSKEDCVTHFITLRQENERVTKEDAKKWLEKAKKEEINGAEVYRDSQRALMIKDKTIVRVELFSKEYKDDYDSLVEAVVIR